MHIVSANVVEPLFTPETLLIIHVNRLLGEAEQAQTPMTIGD
jgi:hypothetical protein